MGNEFVKDALGIKMCEALGVSPDYVHKMTVVLLAGQTPKVTIEMMDFDGKLEAIDWNKKLKQAEVEVNITRVTWDA